MRTLATIGAMALLATGAAAQTPQKTALQQAQLEYVSEIAAMAYFTGACESYFSKADADKMLGAFTGTDLSEPNATQQAFVTAWAQSYVKGRTEAKSRGLDRATCKVLMDQSSASIEKKGAELDRLSADR